MADTLPRYASTLSSPSSSKPHQKPSTLPQQLRAYFSQTVSTQHASIPLLICCLISGLIDSVAYNAWSTFISMQTGNTVFLGLGASDQPLSKPYGWAKSLVSITCFFVSCVCFSRAMRTRGRGTTRGALLASFTVQAVLMLIAAGLVQGKVVPVPIDWKGDPDFIELLPIGLLAFQGGGQLVASRLLGFSEIPTVVLTSVYCDLGMDEKMLAKKNDKRNHRAGSIVLILLGAIAGGWINRSKAGMATAMWVAGALKLGIAVAWVFWRGEEREED